MKNVILVGLNKRSRENIVNKDAIANETIGRNISVHNVELIVNVGSRYTEDVAETKQSKESWLQNGDHVQQINGRSGSNL
jgi:hypothetical protein